MKNKKERVMKRCTLLLLVFLVLWGPAPARADAATKFARGVSNTAFGMFEIPNEMAHEADRHGLFIGSLSGLLRGVLFGTVRTLAGIYEIVSFPFPNWKRGYKPVVLPESVFQRR